MILMRYNKNSLVQKKLLEKVNIKHKKWESKNFI